MPLLIPSLVPAILRHLRAYVEVAGADARDAAAAVARRLVALLFAAVGALVSLLMFCFWLLAIAWDTPWRTWTAAGLALLFAVIAAALAIPVLRQSRRGRGEFFSRVRYEWSRDREVIERAMDGGDGHAHG